MYLIKIKHVKAKIVPDKIKQIRKILLQTELNSAETKSWRVFKYWAELVEKY